LNKSLKEVILAEYPSFKLLIEDLKFFREFFKKFKKTILLIKQSKPIETKKENASLAEIIEQ